jgi:hypothetical protein
MIVSLSCSVRVGPSGSMATMWLSSTSLQSKMHTSIPTGQARTIGVSIAVGGMVTLTSAFTYDGELGGEGG